jgi:hypothetical protein
MTRSAKPGSGGVRREVRTVEGRNVRAWRWRGEPRDGQREHWRRGEHNIGANVERIVVSRR